MTSEAMAGAIFVVLGILLIFAPRHMLRVNAYIMITGGPPEEYDQERGLLVTRALGLLFLLVGGTIIF